MIMVALVFVVRDRHLLEEVKHLRIFPVSHQSSLTGWRIGVALAVLSEPK
jgi:hypothetical protein